MKKNEKYYLSINKCSIYGTRKLGNNYKQSLKEK